MRRSVALLSLVVLAGIAASSVTAAPSDVRLSIDGKAQLVSPTTLLLPMTYVCPEGLGTAFLSASVSQSDTGAQGSGFVGPVLCTGDARTVVVTIFGFGQPWELGSALVRGFVSTPNQFDERTRRIHIDI